MKLPGCELVVIGDLRGRLLRIERGRRHFGAELAVGATLAPLVADESIADLLDLLFAARRVGAALALDLHLSDGTGLALAALARGAELLLLGGAEEGAFLALCRELPTQPKALGGVAPEALARLAALAGDAGGGAPDPGSELRARLEAQERELTQLRAELALLRGEPPSLP